MSTLHEAHEVVRHYSTTWYGPITATPPGLNEATTSAYLCMRAIDEIEDHATLDPGAKVVLLRGVAELLQSRFTPGDFAALFRGHEADLPGVSRRFPEWAALAPQSVRPIICETFAVMASRMADWVERDFSIRTPDDLDRYTFAVSGTLALLLSDLWAWYDGTQTDRSLAISYGRALQGANILIDRDTDTGRGIDFWPDNWGIADMAAFVQREMPGARAYVSQLPESGPGHAFCAPPLLAYQRAIGERTGAARHA